MTTNTKENTCKTLSQSAIMQMGFTKTMIARLLPEPAMTKQNPYYKCAAPVKLWYEDDILSIMETPEYKELAAKAEKRKASARKAVETKINCCRARMDNISETINIKMLPDEKLVNNAIQTKNNWYRELSYRNNWNYIEYADTSNPEYVSRIVVNYIRHHLIKYDKTLKSLKGKPSKDEIYVEFHDKILDRIASAYPKYADECERQKYLKAENN